MIGTPQSHPEQPRVEIPEQDPETIGSNVIDELVGNEEKKTELYKEYPNISLLVPKYRLARDLILDGRFESPRFLLDNFVTPNLQIPDEFKDVAEPLRERLQFLLIQKGVLEPTSFTSDQAERVIRDELHRRKEFMDLIESGWPVEVIGQLHTIDLFKDISDQKKLEELRGWTTRAILRDFLGVITGPKIRREEMTISDMMDRIPNRVFSDPEGVKSHLVESYLEQRIMRVVTDKGIDEGLATLEQTTNETKDPNKKKYLQKISERFYDIATLPLEGDFNSTIIVNGKERTFPSFEQRTFCYDFLNHGTRLLTAETGLGKTGAAYLAMENSDAKRVLVLTPASGRTTWEEEEEKLFKDPSNCFVVKNSNDIKEAMTSGKRYIVVSQNLLGWSQVNPQLMTDLKSLISESEVDGAIIDEIDNLANAGTTTVQSVLDLINDIRTNYESHSSDSRHNAPVIGLTATPIRNTLANLNVPMGLLYPHQYAVTHGESTRSKKTFSDTHLNRPDLVHFTLVGDRKMFRWETATGVQAFSYETIPVEVSPFEEYLYDFIVNEAATDQLNKIRILEDCLFNPLIVKSEVRLLAKDKIPPRESDEILEKKLKIILAEWKGTRNIDHPQKDDDYLSADRLVKLGFGDLVLGCFFDEKLENGIDSLISSNAKLQELNKFWKPREISTRYKKLKEMIEEGLKWRTNEDGSISRQKIFIVSPSRKQGRTGDVLQRTVIDGNGETHDLYTDDELDTINDTVLVKKVKEWVGEEDSVLLLDGSVSVGKPRDEIIKRWVSDPNSAVLLVTLEATYQSRDFTLKVIEDQSGRRIDGIRKIFLGPPWYFQQLKQEAGRSLRQGQLVDVDINILESPDLVDHGKGEAVRYTHLLSRMALSGIVLTKAEQAFFDSKRIGNKIPYQSAESRFLRNAFAYVKGVPETTTLNFLDQQSQFYEEKTNSQLLAEKFFDEGRDEYHVTGYNAEFVSQIVKNAITRTDGRILSVGAGTLLLQRKLERGIDNLDFNPHIMEAGWERAKQYGGRKIVARASMLPEDLCPTGVYDAVDCAFTLQWINLNPRENASSERVKTLAQINRVLKQDGVFILTLPESSFEDSRFKTFCYGLEKHFGFEIDFHFSGKAYGRSKMGQRKRLGWSMVAKKKHGVDVTDLDPDLLRFSDEGERWISYRGKQNGDLKITDKDYPDAKEQIKFDQYEVVNQKRQTTVITFQENPLPTNSVVSTIGTNGSTSIDEDLELLQGTTRKEYQQYQRLLTRVMKTVGLDRDQTEELCVKTFKELKERSGRLISPQEAGPMILHRIKEIEKYERREVTS